MLLPRHTLRQTLLQMGVALQGWGSVALGEGEGEGVFQFWLAVGSFAGLRCSFLFLEGGGMLFFVFYNILWYSKVLFYISDRVRFGFVVFF